MKPESIADCLYLQAEHGDFAGYDPFDGLNSKLFDWFPKLKRGIFGLAWTQFHKRSLINFRPLCGVPARRNPKGVALFISGMLLQYEASGDRALLLKAQELGDWLLDQQCDRAIWQHSCWGYHFDWNARAFFVPKGKPNVITTIYVARALRSLSLATQDPRYVAAADDAAFFIVNHLYTESDGRQFFAYIPGETAFVHNASLWAAAWVAEAYSRSRYEPFKELALRVARQSVAEQGSDGRWVYGSRHHHQFIDSFHTGYNLEALACINSSLATDEFSEVIERGLQFYREHFFGSNGEAYYYHNNAYPYDMHNVAQAVITLLRVGNTDADRVLAKKVIDWSIRTMFLADKGRFCYQKTKYFNNTINYMRWTQAWVYYAFTVYVTELAEKKVEN